MENKIREIIDKAIEEELEKHISNIGSSELTLALIGEFVDGCYKAGNFQTGEYFRPSLEILIPKIMNTVTVNVSDIDPNLLIKACEFANEYYYIRDLIYISFSFEDAIEWRANNGDYEIIIKDYSIFRQLVAEFQSFSLNSMQRNEGILNVDEILSLLSEEDHKDANDTNNANLNKVLESIKREVEWKIHHFFSYIPEQSSIDMGGYKYSEFLSVYKELLFLSLYERNRSMANNLSCVITYDEEEISEAIAQETSLRKECCIRIIRDISMSSRNTLNFISKTKKYVLFPFSFSLKDGISAILKHYAKNDSDAFSANCAGIIGSALVEKVADYFSSYPNFYVFKEVMLNAYNSELPDIDLLIISYEPSLGFHCFVCEMKNNLPASWAKEYLKASGKKGFVQKALSQSEKVSNFLKTEEGAKLIYEKIIVAFPNLDYNTLFPTGFCAVIDHLIVTSQSVGMFFSNKQITIINENLLGYFVANSDGDVNYIIDCLRNIDQILDDCYEIKKQSIVILGKTIEYDVCEIKQIICMSENEYLTSGELERLERESLESGYRFIDCIE